MAVRSAFTSISTVLRLLSDDVVRNLERERFTCLMYSSSTEQTELQRAPKRTIHHWEQTTRNFASNEGMFEGSRAKLNQHTHVRKNGDGKKLIVTGSLSGPL